MVSRGPRCSGCGRLNRPVFKPPLIAVASADASSSNAQDSCSSFNLLAASRPLRPPPYGPSGSTCPGVVVRQVGERKRSSAMRLGQMLSRAAQFAQSLIPAIRTLEGSILPTAPCCVSMPLGQGDGTMNSRNSGGTSGGRSSGHQGGGGGGQQGGGRGQGNGGGWPSGNPGQPSGGGRSNNPPGGKR